MFDNHVEEFEVHDTIVVSGFPGVGKTTFFERFRDIKSADSDSSRFSWSEPGVRNPDFPQNYIDYIKASIGRFDFIFVSSHDLVREALKEEGIPYSIVYPSKALKDEYIRRYVERGNQESFVQLLETNFDQFIESIEQDDYPTRIPLQSGEYLSDVIYVIQVQGEYANELPS